MKKISLTETAIEDLVAATCGKNATARQKHVYRETLRGLVRLAKSEQMFEMRTNVDKLAGTISARTARRRAKSILLAQRPGNAGQRQAPLEFNQR
jgi:hypothetical protein